MNYDIIGDIHGHDGALVALLNKLGYPPKGRSRHKAGHMAIHVGDFIDRGPGQMETVNWVRSMVDSGSALAVMGNHEFNALAWNTPDPQNRISTCDRIQIRISGNTRLFWQPPMRHRNCVRMHWTGSWPCRYGLDLPNLRVVHAGWHPVAMDKLRPLLKPGHRIDLNSLEAACQRGSRPFDAIEAILKGPEVRLPDGMQFRQGDTMRSEARTRWWNASANTFKQSAFVDTEARANLPELPIPEDVRFGYPDEKPVFFGHYWMQGKPEILMPRVACVDYSAGAGEPLAAYRWQGESTLVQEHFVSAAASRERQSQQNKSAGGCLASRKPRCVPFIPMQASASAETDG